MIKEDLDFFTELIGETIGDGPDGKYILFCCQQAKEIATTLETKEKIVEFHKMDSSRQKQLVPSLSDEHSGNTFDISCRLAISYLPQLLVNKRDKKIETIIK